ncbi:unnamed protein product [Cyclocybe aegerita]|uniref:Cytochrome P450 n=1 Tax=Cyclocybe aegerita TaxID=1973307 RepID=A0A8S0XT50_CYCAE|nr:unnamed protein product [Cyclocybe aegerita]
MYMLIEHPDIERRLRQEIFDTVGNSGRPSEETLRIVASHPSDCDVEVLRLYPPIPLNSRLSNKDIVFPPIGVGEKPIFIPKNTTCLFHIINMHHRTDLWGPDALKFDPDRFLDEKYQKYLAHNAHIYAPFGTGQRLCLGQQFAINEGSYFLVRLLQRFTGFTLERDITAKPPPEWVSCYGLKGREKIRIVPPSGTLVPGGLWIRMRELDMILGGANLDVYSRIVFDPCPNPCEKSSENEDK